MALQMMMIAVVLLGFKCLVDSLFSTFIADKLDPWIDKAPWREIVLKPLILCHICMTSFWGTITYFSLYEPSWNFPFVLAGSAFFNVLFYAIIERIER